MKPGDKVKVYEDPIACQKLEGEANLVQKQPRYRVSKGLENWVVKFSGDAHPLYPCVERLINKNNH